MTTLLKARVRIAVVLGLALLMVMLVLLPGTLSSGQSYPPTPTADAAGWRTYPDTDPQLVYSDGTWQTYTVAAAVDGTLTGTTDADATLTADFAGTAITVIYAKGPEGGPFTMQVDGGGVLMGDSYAPGYDYGYMLTYQGLADGLHTLTVTNGSGAFWIEAVAVQGELLPAGSVASGGAGGSSQPGETLTPTPEAQQHVYVDDTAVGCGSAYSGMGESTITDDVFGIVPAGDPVIGVAWIYTTEGKTWASVNGVVPDHYGVFSTINIHIDNGMGEEPYDGIYCVTRGGNVDLTGSGGAYITEAELCAAVYAHYPDRVAKQVTVYDSTLAALWLHGDYGSTGLYQRLAAAYVDVPAAISMCMYPVRYGENTTDPPDPPTPPPTPLPTCVPTPLDLNPPPEPVGTAQAPPIDECIVPDDVCHGYPISSGVKVHKTRELYGELRTWTVNGINYEAIPQGATITVTHKSVEDLSLWYYVEGYFDPNTQEQVIFPQDEYGNWVFHRNLVFGLTNDFDATRPYCGLALEAELGGEAELDDECNSVSTLTQACQELPWNPDPVCDGNGSLEGNFCVYTYDREKAAEYATSYARWPNPDASPGPGSEIESSNLFCTYNYGGAHTACAPTERPVYPLDPNTPDIPCIRNPEGNCLFPTDCANFTSVAMWYGGLPMTERWFGTGVPVPIADTSENYSWTWAGVHGQPEYLRIILPQYTTEEVITPFTPTWDEDGDPDTLDDANTISYLHPGFNLNYIQKTGDVWLGDPELGDPNGHGIAKGDIVWVKKENVEHMMVVAGWGPMLITWEEIDAFWAANGDDYSVLTTTYPNPGNFVYNPHPEFGYVPYLVDHGPHGATEAPGGDPDSIPVLMCEACVKPRPYYALYWPRDGYPLLSHLDRVRNAPQFIHIPDSLGVPVEEVKLSPDNLDPNRVIPPTPTPTQ